MDLPISSAETSTVICSGRSFGSARHLDLEENVLQHAAACLDADCFADGLNGHVDGHHFVFGHFMKVHVENVAFERMMLNILNQRQALGARIILHCKINEHVFGKRNGE